MTTRRLNLESHLAEIEEENIQYMLDGGSSLEEACRRAGVSLATYQKRQEEGRAPRPNER